MKRSKIKGVSGGPLLFTRWHGRLDGKRGVVQYAENKWNSHYINKRLAAFSEFSRSVFGKLEEETETLHSESMELLVEFEEQRKALRAAVPDAPGATPSIQTRNAAKISAERSARLLRCAEIPPHLSKIDEQLNAMLNKADAVYRQAAAETEKRIEEYLHGAALAAGQVHDAKFCVELSNGEEENYLARHRFNDETRRSFLKKYFKEAYENE